MNSKHNSRRAGWPCEHRRDAERCADAERCGGGFSARRVHRRAARMTAKGTHPGIAHVDAARFRAAVKDGLTNRELVERFRIHRDLASRLAAPIRKETR